MRALRGKEVEHEGSGSAGTASGDNAAKALDPANGSRPWLGLRDPRIVRVSRAFGGKDRHSKVSTVKGLRDRRVRLSVPTAIQLYDLQDRLGLSQPSKVVDWLLAATQEEIDKLPPLPIPPSGLPFYQCSGGPAITHAAPPATALCMANGYGSGGVDYLDGTDVNLFASTCYSREEPTGEAGGLLSHSEEVTPLTLLPSSQGQFLFCAPNGMAMAAPIFPSYAATTTAYMTATASSFPSDFSSLLKSSVFSRSEQHK